MTLYSEFLPMVTTASTPFGPEQGHWTYEDYARLPSGGKHYEVMDGFLLMSPSPTWSHQNAALRIASRLSIHMETAGLGEAIIAPFDVELAPDVVVQPDIMVILKGHFDRLTENRVIGAPDLVVEVASPGTATYDRNRKSRAYAAAGVPEYWIVDPEARAIELLVLDGSSYQTWGIYRGKALLPSRIVPTLNVSVEQLFVRA